MKWNHSILISRFLLAFIAFAFWSCQDDGNDIIDRNYQLVWEDNFTGPAGQSPDATKWTYDIGIGPGNDGWGNQELQYYTDRPENVALDGAGNLAITARSESYAGRAFTSARINTKGIFSQAYGRFEARIKMPWGPGIWPAFWMLGDNIDEVSWPQCGEIDIMEYLGHEPKTTHGTLHYNNSGHRYQGDSYNLPGAQNFNDNFHIFSLVWSEYGLKWYVDYNLFFELTDDEVAFEAFRLLQFFIMNVAVGGNWPGYPDETTVFPQTMQVDYVRVFKPVE